MARGTSVLLRLLLALALLGSSATVASEAFAQEGEAAAEQAPTDPSDEIVRYITDMTALVKSNMDDPEQVKSAFKSYLAENGAKMKKAGVEFEAHLNGLSADEAQTYKETLQRKMEKALEEFLKTMLDFSERHPEAAKELDEMLQRAK